MIAPIKRYDALGDIDGGYLKASADGRVVLHTDHLASHAYDEAVERAAAFAACPDGYDWGTFWMGWKYSAKSRAKRFGGSE